MSPIILDIFSISSGVILPASIMCPMSPMIPDMLPIMPPIPFISSLFIMRCPFIMPFMPLCISAIFPCISFILPIIMLPSCMPPDFMGISRFSWAIRGTNPITQRKKIALKIFFITISLGFANTTINCSRYQNNLLSAAHESRYITVRQNLDCLATKNQCRHASASVRGHDTQIATPLLRSSNDGFVGMIMHHMYTLVRDAGSVCSIARQSEVVFGSGIGVFLVLLRRFSNNHWINRESMKRLRDGDRCHLCIDCVGQCDTLLYGFCRKLRTVGGD